MTYLELIKKSMPHVVLIKQLEQQFNQLSTTVNPRQPGTLPSNTIQNQKNNGHCMAIEIVVERDEDKIEVTRESKNATEKKAEVTQKVVPMPRPPLPFPQRLVKKTEEGKYHRFITMLEQLFINVTLIEALEQIPGYSKFVKDLVTKKRDANIEDGAKLQHCSAISMRSLKLGLRAPRQTEMRLLIADRTMKKPIGVLQDVLVKVESFIFPADFVILDCEVDFEIPIILGRLFLTTRRALVDMERGKMKF
ncbi:hypothetical protein R3W88_016331 [Solanum pinnatisectum]|uniref:Uncharacterized protein n=1 Tax=Solanum pinnatisectum TaxID=50273 RepID=A0AAV9KXS7_9SOLN|nr:hypothetical protein R3W88_016331 [Solanum pinnatisectum]